MMPLLALPDFDTHQRLPVIRERQETYEAKKPKLLDQVRNALRAKHYSIHTEEAYLHWIKRYILFHHKRHPQEMNSPEIEQFLTYLAVERNVAASTQNQTLAALLFLYQQVLRQPLVIVQK